MVMDPEKDCDCRFTELIWGPHKVGEHYTPKSCGGWTFNPPCGGCLQCVIAQYLYYIGTEIGSE